MVGNTGTLMTMRIVRNKIRNRDDCNTNTNANNNAIETAPQQKEQQQQQEQIQQQQQQVQSTTTTNMTTTNNNNSNINTNTNNVGFKMHKQLSISFRLPKERRLIGENGFFGARKSMQQNNTNKNNNNSNNVTNNINNNNNSNNTEVVTFARTSGISTTQTWVFPPQAPTPHIYHCLDTDALMAAANDNSGFKGFRKQFSGRFKRLVAAKKPEPAPVIPPHLKPQLKTIYVY